MKGHGDKCGRKTDDAILALLAHPTIPQAAKACGISEVTLWRWLQIKDFAEKYRQAKKKVWDMGIAHLQHAAGAAVQTLLAVATDVEAPASARVSAARTILDLGQKSIEIGEIESRLAEIEKKVRG